jgi:hypothetical protein
MAGIVGVPAIRIVPIGVAVGSCVGVAWTIHPPISKAAKTAHNQRVIFIVVSYEAVSIEPSALDAMAPAPDS